MKLIPILAILAVDEEIGNNNLLSSILTRQKIKYIGEKSVTDKLNEDARYSILNNYNQLANLYIKTGNYRAAQQELALSHQLWNRYEHDFTEQFEYDLMYSYATFKIGAPSDAYPIMQRQVARIDSLAQSGEYLFNEQVIGKLVLAEILLALNDPQRAESYAQTAVDIQQTFIPEALSYESYGKYILAKTWLASGQYGRVTALITPVLQKHAALSQDAYQQVNFVDIAQLYELMARAQLATYSSEGQVAALYQAQHYAAELLWAVDIAWRNLKNQDDLRFTLHQYFEFIETPLRVQYQLYATTDSVQHLQAAIQLMERSRNIQLRASLRRSNLASQLGVPNHLLEREEKLRRELFEKNFQLDQSATATTQYSVLEEELLQLRQRQQAVSEEIAEIAPDLSRAVHRQRSFTLEQLGVQLAPRNQTALLYTIGEEISFVIAVNAKTVMFERIEVGRQELQALVNDYRAAIYDQPDETTAATRQQLATISHQLYQLLIAPVADVLTDRLVIIPDGPLEILPFSSLLLRATSGSAPFSTWPYLLKQYSLNYAYSLELLLYPMPAKAEPAHQKILAFAPAFQGEQLRAIAQRSQGQLDANQQEISFIADQFVCDAYYGTNAQLGTFLDQASDYSVLHLATHAVANDQIGAYSYLAFSESQQDHQLEVGDLYGRQIPADMVVLSACETGLGEWQRGEGMVGLERAFFYAGAQSLVSTHWKVSDRASAQLMSLFYDQLNRGLPKDVALQTAQVDFIHSHEDWLAHPFFWAGFVQKGDTAPLAVPRRTTWHNWLIVGAVGLLVLAVWAWWRASLFRIT
ncbi:MAG: CHAT domain-containing protein [Bacteroidota bacterium]